MLPAEKGKGWFPEINIIIICRRLLWQGAPVPLSSPLAPGSILSELQGECKRLRLRALGALGLQDVQVSWDLQEEVQAGSAWADLGQVEWEGRAGHGSWAGIWAVAAQPLSSAPWFSPSLSPGCFKGYPQLMVSV